MLHGITDGINAMKFDRSRCRREKKIARRNIFFQVRQQSETDIVYRNTCQKHEAMFRLLDNSFDNARLTEIRKFENLTSYSANFLNAIIGLDLLKKTV